MRRPVAAWLARAVAVAALLVPAMALPAAADGAFTTITSGGSIVFARDHNIWLTSPDGRAERPLTTNGTAAAPYHSPTQSADGAVVVAVQDPTGRRRGGSLLYVMDRQGTLLRTPFAPPQYTTVIGGSCSHGVRELGYGIVAAVSPDATKIMVNKLGVFFSPFGGFCDRGIDKSEMYVINLDGAIVNASIPPTDGAAPLSLEQAAWVGNSRLVMYTGNFGGDLSTGIFYYDLGAAAARLWIKAPYGASAPKSDLAYRSPTLAGSTLATTGASTRVQPVLRLWTTSGPPAAPIPRCEIESPDHPDYEFDFEITGATLASDGSAVAWVEADVVLGVPTTSGIYVSPVSDIAADCSSVNRQLLIAGGSDPDWGAAVVGPPGPGTSLPTCPAGQPGTPPDCKAPLAACPAGQAGTPPACTTPAGPGGQDPQTPESGRQAPASPGGGPQVTNGVKASARTIVRTIRLPRGCSPRQLTVSGRGVKVRAAKRLRGARCRLTLRVAADARGRRNLLVKLGRRTTTLRGVIRL